jgi:hypothetical protein
MILTHLACRRIPRQVVLTRMLSALVDIATVNRGRTTSGDVDGVERE